MPNTENPGEFQPSRGGPGEDRPTRGDMAMIRRAIEDRWPVSAAHRQAAVNAVTKILANLDPSNPASNRDRLAAAKTLVAMDRGSLEWARFEREDPSAGKDADDYQFDLDLSPPDPPDAPKVDGPAT